MILEIIILRNEMKIKYSIFTIMALNISLIANETITLEQMSITATKVQRATKEISENCDLDF